MATFTVDSEGGTGFLSFLNSSGTTHGLFCCQTEYTSVTQIRARSEAKRILRALRLGCARGDIAARKFSHNGEDNESKPNGGYSALCSYLERRMSHTSSALKNRMAAATVQATTTVKREFTNSPILVRSPVNWISGITANGNWKLRIT